MDHDEKATNHAFDILVPDVQMRVRRGVPFREAKRNILESFERTYLYNLLKHHKWNISAASRESRLSRKHIRTLIAKYDLASAGTGVEA